MQTGLDYQPALLILDLDETLIHTAEVELQELSSFRVGPFAVYERPGVRRFLQSVARHYALAIWSSAGEEYVSQIAKKLSEAGVEWAFVWSRSRCTERLEANTLEYVYHKDLKKVKRIGYDLARVLIVDDSPEKLSRNYGNAVYVKPFTGQPNDNELEQLSQYLISESACLDFRSLEKRGWKTKRN